MDALELIGAYETFRAYGIIIRGLEFKSTGVVSLSERNPNPKPHQKEGATSHVVERINYGDQGTTQPSSLARDVLQQKSLLHKLTQGNMDGEVAILDDVQKEDHVTIDSDFEDLLPSKSMLDLSILEALELRKTVNDLYGKILLKK